MSAYSGMWVHVWTNFMTSGNSFTVPAVTVQICIHSIRRYLESGETVRPMSRGQGHQPHTRRFTSHIHGFRRGGSGRLAQQSTSHPEAKFPFATRRPPVPREHHQKDPLRDTPSRLGSRKPPTMVLQDLGRRINTAVTNLTREPNLDEKVRRIPTPQNHSSQSPHDILRNKS